MKNIFKRKIVSSLIVTTSIMIATTSFGSGLKSSYDRNTKKWGFENTTGKVIISAKYDGVSEFVNGYAPVKLKNLWGFIDTNGKEIAQPTYNGVANFKDGYAPVLKGDKWGMIDTSGKEVISFKYSDIYYFDAFGSANAKKDGKWGKIDKSENEVVPFIYDESELRTKHKEITSKVILNGVEMELHAYQIHNNNYVKIRDIAKSLDQSEKQFEVSWDKEKGRIDLLSGQPYTTVGGELEKSEKKSNKLRFTESLIAKDGENIILKGYNIDNNNYFKIRDIVKAFNIGLTWNQETKTTEINTAEDYIE